MNRLVVLLGLVGLIGGQKVFFPDDDGNVPEMQAAFGAAAAAPALSLPIPKNLTELRGSTEYEKYVDQIITNGLIKLTLGINKAITSQQMKDNVVYAPVSIGAALALILLGSNGKTFDEMVNILGLTSGLDIQYKTQIVHEEFGRLIRQLENTSGFNLGNQADFANAVFVQENFPIRTLYKQTAETLYESEILNLNFLTDPGNAQRTINAWVTDRTKGKIKDLLGEAPSASTKVIIASAMYFKASWEKPFFDGTTRRRAFYTNGRKFPSNIEVEMMTNGGNFPYFRDTNLNCEIMGFPYKGNQTTMYVVMPFDSDKQKLKELEDRLTPEELQRLVSRVVDTPSVILFPKMKIDSTIDLRKALESIGVKSLFNPLDANLALLSPGAKTPIRNNNNDIFIFNRISNKVNCSEIFNPNSNISNCVEVVNDNNRQQRVAYKKIGNKLGRKLTENTNESIETLDTIRQLINKQSTSNSFQNPGLYADKVVHKVYMDITESGTEAAAVTSVSLSRDGGRISFRVDSPFLFFIQHEASKAILFWGSVTNPVPNFKV